MAENDSRGNWAEYDEPVLPVEMRSPITSPLGTYVYDYRKYWEQETPLFNPTANPLSTCTYDPNAFQPLLRMTEGASYLTGFCYESRLFDGGASVNAVGYVTNMVYDTPGRYPAGERVQLPEVDEPLIIEVPKENE